MSTDPKPAVLLRNYYERTIAVDDVTGDATIPIRIRRFTPDQLLAFNQGWARIENPPSERAIYRKDGEQDVPMSEVRRRRLVEMSPDERAAFEQADADDAAYAAEYCRTQMAANVSVSPSVSLVMEDEDGNRRAVKTGADLVAVFAGNLDMLLLFTRAIWEENTLNAEKKRALRRLSASSSSSASPAPSNGERPAAIAAPVAPPDSASAAAASAPSDPTPSSETA